MLKLKHNLRNVYKVVYFILITMEKKQVIIISLLIVAIVLSTTSVMMNVSVMNDINLPQGQTSPAGDITLEVLPTQENTGVTNELG